MHWFIAWYFATWRIVRREWPELSSEHTSHPETMGHPRALLEIKKDLRNIPELAYNCERIAKRAYTATSTQSYAKIHEI